ncbi:MAG: DUF1295 domain-containing protein [Clostridia bacterium]|nr:DUF1295 domain-containing protein [Clostridia bacterium]
MNWKYSRSASFLIVTLVYLLAIASGVGVYWVLPFDFWLNLLIADIAATIVTFIFSVIFANASVYDPYWSVQPPVILIAFAIGKPLTVARVFMLIAVCFWGVRLTANWAYTFHGLNHQDWRYTMLKEKTGAFYPLINFLGIHLVPTLVVYGCVLPAVFLFETQTGWNAGSVLFFLVSIGATTLQAVADIQMQRFRKHASAPFIRDGVWKYSRHPNYLGEILMWWGVALAAISVLPTHWYLCAGALANTLLFAFVSIPMAERRQSQKEGFEEYKRQTRILLPIVK